MWENGKGKSKYAIVLVGSNQYLPGINAIINTLDYYDNRIDLHFIHDKLPEEYEKRLKNADLNFHLVLQSFPDLHKQMLKDYPEFPSSSSFYNHIWLRYWYILKIKDDYEVISSLDADSIVVNHIVPWFEFAKGTSYLLTAQHCFGGCEIEEINPKNYSVLLPIFNHPLICNPKEWSDIFEKMILSQKTEKREGDMQTLNRILFLNKCFEKVFPLLDCQWIGKYIWENRIIEKKLRGKYFLFGSPNVFRINIIHGKWWGRGFRENQLKSSQHKEIMKSNLELILAAYKRLNEEWKVQWNLPTEFGQF